MTRLTASAGPAASVSGVTVLGVEPDAIRAEPLWRDDWGVSRDDGRRRRSSGTGRPVSVGRSSPARSSRVAVGPGLLSYRGLVEQRDGGFRAIELGAADPRRPTVLRAPLPRDARGARLVGVELVAPRLLDRGADAGIALRGATTLRVRGASLDGWIGEGGVALAGRSTGGPGLRVSYAVTAQRHARSAAAPAHGRRSAGRPRHARAR